MADTALPHGFERANPGTPEQAPAQFDGATIAWETVMAEYLGRQAITAHYLALVHRPAEQAALLDPRTGMRAPPEPIIENLEALENEENNALVALMKIPAPNIAALRFKLDEAFALEDGAMTPWCEHYIQQTIADYRRLLGGLA